jgi:hypothetical protein
MKERVREPEAGRHSPIQVAQPPNATRASGSGASTLARSHDRWVINKVRALGSWYTKGLEGGSQLRAAINSTESLGALRDLIGNRFFMPASMA